MEICAYIICFAQNISIQKLIWENTRLPKESVINKINVFKINVEIVVHLDPGVTSMLSKEDKNP